MALSTMDMRLLCHGGGCCGVKHIEGFYSHPSSDAPECDEQDDDGIGDGSWQHKNRSKPWFVGKAPKEMNQDRLQRYIDFVKTHQGGALIECILDGCQNSMWATVLGEKGFKKVQEFLNSNSGGRLHVYHLVTFEGDD